MRMLILLVVPFVLSLSATAENEHPTIGSLQTQSHLISIHNSAAGPVYTVKTRAGEILGEKITKNELSAKFPEIAELVKEGIADDASIDPKHFKSRKKLSNITEFENVN